MGTMIGKGTAFFGAGRDEPKNSHSFLTQKELDPDSILFEVNNRRVNFGWRPYSPFRGQFTQADPLSLILGQLGHLYVYVDSAPTLFVDPLGLYKDVSHCQSVNRIAKWILDETAGAGATAFAQSMSKLYKADLISFGEIGRTGDLRFEIIQQSRWFCQGRCDCINEFNLVLHRGGAIDAQDGDLTWGAYGQGTALTWLPKHHPFRRDRLVDSKSKVQKIVEDSLKNLGSDLGDLACDPCVINVYGCSMGKNLAAMAELARSSGCKVYAADFLMILGAAGWTSDANQIKRIFSVDKLGRSGFQEVPFKLGEPLIPPQHTVHLVPLHKYRALSEEEIKQIIIPFKEK